MTVNPPAGDQLTPIPVHVASIAVQASIGGEAPRRGLRTRFITETVDDTNPVRPLLPADPALRCAHVQVSGGDVFLCGSRGDAERPTPDGAVLPSGNTAPWPLRGQGGLWAAQKTAGTTCVVSVTADYADPP